MYAYLEGTVAEVSSGRVVLDVGGIGYLLHVSTATASACAHAAGASTKRPVRLLAHLVVTDGDPKLYGFATAEERDLFRLLTSVSGVGPSTAMALLSSLSPSELASALADADEGTLRAVKGIGSKTARRLVVELKDAVLRLRMGEPSSPARRDAVAALLALGFARHEAERLIDGAARSQAQADSEELVKLALAASRRS